MNISTVQRKSDISLSFQRATTHMQSAMQSPVRLSVTRVDQSEIS